LSVKGSGKPDNAFGYPKAMLAKLVLYMMPFVDILFLLAKNEKILILANRIDIIGVYYWGRN